MARRRELISELPAFPPKVPVSRAVRASQITDGEFVPQFTEEGKPFICFENGAETLPDEPLHED